MPIKTFITFLLILSGAATTSFPFNDSGYNFYQLAQKPFIIHYVRDDSTYAQQALAILVPAFEEITYDFQFTSANSFQVYIMPTRKSFREALRGRLPRWTGAYANPAYNIMVIKSPRWHQTDSFRATLIHELFHLIIHQYLGPRDLPRWLDEGLAIFYSGEERWKTETALSKAVSTRSLIPLSDIDYVLDYHEAKADLAYQQSYSAVYYLLTTYDIEAVRQIIAGLKSDKSIHQCFLAATGSTFHDFELEWQKHVRQTHKWMWFSEINEYVWVLIFVLVFLAFIMKKIRNRRIEKQWQAEQQTSLSDEEDT